jgi:pimeloyl-ACP methyl ester carboxylesterase
VSALVLDARLHFFLLPTIRIGPSEFTITGSLKTWDITAILPNITYPTLLINGADDESTDADMDVFFKQIPNSKWVQFGRSSHTAMFEEPEKYFRIVGDFLTD